MHNNPNRNGVLNCPGPRFHAWLHWEGQLAPNAPQGSPREHFRAIGANFIAFWKLFLTCPAALRACVQTRHEVRRLRRCRRQVRARLHADKKQPALSGERGPATHMMLKILFACPVCSSCSAVLTPAERERERERRTESREGASQSDK